MVSELDSYIRQLCHITADHYRVRQSVLYRYNAGPQPAKKMIVPRYSVWYIMNNYLCMNAPQIAVAWGMSHQTITRSLNNFLSEKYVESADEYGRIKEFFAKIDAESDFIRDARDAAARWKRKQKPGDYVKLGIPAECTEFSAALRQLAKIAAPLYRVNADDLFDFHGHQPHHCIQSARRAVWYYAVTDAGATFDAVSKAWFGHKRFIPNVNSQFRLFRDLVNEPGNEELYGKFRNEAHTKVLNALKAALVNKRAYARKINIKEIRPPRKSKISDVDGLLFKSNWYPKARAIRGISLEEAARNAGCSTGFLRHIENTGVDVNLDGIRTLALSLSWRGADAGAFFCSSVISNVDNKIRSADAEFQNIVKSLVQSSEPAEQRLIRESLYTTIAQLIPGGARQ